MEDNTFPVSCFKEIEGKTYYFDELGFAVTGIYEVTGLRNGEVALETLYEFRETGENAGRVEGALVRTGELRHTEKLLARNGRL